MNRWIRKGILQVVGSPWLPGFWVLRPEDATRALVAIKQERLPVKLLLAVTSEPMRANKNWSSFEADPLMTVAVQWTSFESYGQEMKKKYRARLNKALKSNSDVEVRLLSADKAEFSKAAELLAATLTDRVVAMPENLEWLLAMYQECFGSSFQMHGFFLQGALIGFISTIEDGKFLRAMHYGSIENTPQDFYSYAMFYAIRRGIEGGFEKVSLGRTATEIKSTYGAEPEENYFSFYTENWFFRWLLKLAQNRYQPKTYVLRRPFK
ncbi:MAG: GNAT family N-acetyltransferase [Flavobacteriaceae bacterium]|nr:GNAT family N-acetyltransferase [Flavobacteriaceae bacterium]